jgi:MFS family permease
LPTISLSFQISAGTGSWLAIAYFLVLSSVLLLFCRLGDVIGFKKIFMSGLGSSPLDLFSAPLHQAFIS